MLRSQTHELKMCQMDEEINLGRHTIESAIAKHQVKTIKKGEAVAVTRLLTTVGGTPTNSRLTGLPHPF